MSDFNWNLLVPESNRLDSPNKNNRKHGSQKPTHIVIHVTGTNSFNSVKNIFMAENSVSAHYVVGKKGELHQFVPDGYRAWHAGVDSNTRALYKKGAAVWQKYLKFFSWYKSYPADSIYLDGDLKTVWDKTEAMFVALSSGGAWPHYEYFCKRWSNADQPINFAVDADPNNFSIGIETLGFGSPTSDPAVYTPEMYNTLRALVQDLSMKYDIPVVKGRVVGHEDVNPVGRFGWDPAAGFDWARIYS